MKVGSVSTRQPRDRGLVLAVIYIMVIGVIALTCLIPLYVIRRYDMPAAMKTSARFLHDDAYAILNVIVYGIMNKKYRQTLKSVFNFTSCQNWLCF